MTKKITIAIDAMGGENSPKKNIEGLKFFLDKRKTQSDFVINLYGDKNLNTFNSFIRRGVSAHCINCNSNFFIHL